MRPRIKKAEKVMSSTEYVFMTHSKKHSLHKQENQNCCINVFGKKLKLSETEMQRYRNSL